MAEQGGRRRVFFALWPDTTTAAAIDRVADALVVGGRRMQPSRLHMTLAFAGTVDAAVLERLLTEAAGVGGSAFVLRLDQPGYFRRPRIPWLGPSQPPPPLLQLAAALARQIDPQSRLGRFRPHVSLARRAPPVATARRWRPVVWPVHEFCLVESGRAGAPGKYRCLQRWQLQ